MEGQSRALDGANLGREPVAGVDRPSTGTIVVKLQGELDLFNAEPLRTTLFAAAEERPARLVLDLGDVQFVDSTALGIMIEASSRLGDAGGLTIATPGLETRRALEISGLDRHFTVCETLEQALA